jgi:hypothetical protein
MTKFDSKQPLILLFFSLGPMRNFEQLQLNKKQPYYS